MFNSTSVNVSHTANIKIKKEAQQQVLEMRKEHEQSFIVPCKVDDDVWKGLFYERPFLNKSMETKANCGAINFRGGHPEDYENFSWVSREQNAKWEDDHNARVKKIISEQAVEVLQVKILDKTGQALVEVRWADNPAA